MRVKPLTLEQANEIVEKHHRHHKPVQGHRFSVGAYEDNAIVGAAIVGRPVSRCVDPCAVAEITRLVTDGTKNACSFLYGACARIAKEMGFEKIQTYILDSESGKSLKASGWMFEEMTSGGDWNHSKQFNGKRRTDQPMSPKQRWSKNLITAAGIPR
jgi:hypothetical protein